MIPDHNRVMRVHGIDAGAWAKRYGLELFTAACAGCGSEMRATLPFACGKLRGLVAPDCACGHEQSVYEVTTASDRDDLLEVLAGMAPRRKARKPRKPRKKRRRLRLVADDDPSDTTAL